MRKRGLRNEKRYFMLNRDCLLEKGRKNGVICNFLDQSYYCIDKEGLILLDNCNKGIDLKTLRQRTQLRKSRLISFLSRLEDLKLGRFYRYKVFIDSYDKLEDKAYDIEKSNEKVRIRTLIIEINQKCGLNCIQCNSIKNNNNYNFCGCSLSEYDREFQLIKVEKMMRDIMIYKPDEVFITGGDPFLSGKLLVKLISFLKGLGISTISIFTNGTAISKSIISPLKENDVKLYIPIYSYENNYHDSITRNSGSFKATKNNIESLNKNKINIIPIIYITERNYHNFNKIVEFVKEISSEPYKVDFIYPKVGKYLRRSANKDFIKAYNSFKQYVSLDYESYLTNKLINYCLFGKVAITLGGNILPCQSARNNIIGNIFNNQLKINDVLKRGLIDFYWYLTKDKTGICKYCEFRYICLDCPVLAHKIDGPVISGNLYCNYNPLRGGERYE